MCMVRKVCASPISYLLQPSFQGAGRLCLRLHDRRCAVFGGYANMNEWAAERPCAYKPEMIAISDHLYGGSYR